MEKMIPHNTQEEQTLLGMLLCYPSQMAKVIDWLAPTDFYHDANAEIYRTMQSLYRRGKKCNQMNVIDTLRVREQLEDVGDEQYLRTLANNVMELTLASSLNIEDCASAIKDSATHRGLISLAFEMTQDGFLRRPDALERAERGLYALAQGIDTQAATPLSAAIDSYLAVLDKRVDNFRKGIANGIPTGFSDLDQMLGGLQPGDLSVLAARPSVGKTALSLNVALNIIQHSKRVVFFSLEMNNDSLVQRLLSMEAHVDQSFMRDGDLEDDQLKAIRTQAKLLHDLDLHIDSRTRTLAGIKSKARRLHGIKPLQLIVVDYLQLMDTAEATGANRAVEIGKLSTGLKALAMELGVPVLALAQLNRAVESRAEKKPQLSDLRDSGQIEQDSDNIIFLSLEADQVEKRMNNTPYNVTVSVSKQRNGRVGEILLEFRPRLTKFQDVGGAM